MSFLLTSPVINLIIFHLQVILTGHPIRVRKKFAVVKHMFYDPMDVRWFKPAEMVRGISVF